MLEASCSRLCAKARYLSLRPNANLARMIEWRCRSPVDHLDELI
jgi:hypothetical protein